jgi:hypothetical protein
MGGMVQAKSDKKGRVVFGAKWGPKTGRIGWLKVEQRLLVP